ncbi:MAG: hypothetical protein PHZ09_00465 [Eubacteriales bacterium]|nr:hypothetical protein [Eubacteriales bacterium]
MTIFNTKKLVGLFLIGAMLTAASCSKDTNSLLKESTESTDNAIESNSEIEYVYKYAKTFDGYEFRILNAGDIYNMRAEINREEITGDALDDMMYNRCRKVEQNLDIVIEETTEHVDSALANRAQQVIVADEDLYDIIYIPARDLYRFIEGGYLYNLLDFDALQLDMPWWSQSYNNSCIITDDRKENRLYAAIGASQLMYIDSLWCLFFNETMMSGLNLDMPYNLVREGKWTLDRLSEYLKAGARINGDSSFDWDEKGNCIYGLSGTAFDKFLAASGEFFVEMQDGKLEFTAGSEHFYNVAEKLVSITTKNDGRRIAGLSGVPDGQPGNYITNFEVQRSLFMTAELSKTSRMRDKDFSYGIVPFPKYDEGYMEYYSWPCYGTPGFTIPITVAEPERSAIIGDALAYLGYDMVLPVFHEVTLEQKGLRNDDSIMMLDLIINSSRADLCYIYNAGSDMRSAVMRRLDDGDVNIASVIASYDSSVKETLLKING